MLKPAAGQNFSNQVKAGISGIGGGPSTGNIHYGGAGAFGPNKNNMYANAPTSQAQKSHQNFGGKGMQGY